MERNIPPDAPPARIIFSSKTSNDKALVLPPTLYNPLFIQFDLLFKLDFGSVLENINSLLLIFLGILLVFGLASLFSSHKALSIGLSDA